MIIKNGNVITPKGIIENCHVSLSHNIISALGQDFRDNDVIDASGMYVCPGFVDIHTHGGYGGDFMDADDESFIKAIDFHSENGTTSILATSVTAPVDSIEGMLVTARKYINVQDPKCRILGAHIEGPYLSVKNKGAQHEEYLRVPSEDAYDFILQNKDVIKTVTISPELSGAPKMVQDLTEAGIVVCGGHDDGEKDKIVLAIDAGLRHCTHLWCAMSSAVVRDNVRRPGLLEIGLSNEKLSVEIIADNHHMAPEMVKIVYKCKGPEKMCIVSDSLRAGGMPEDGAFYLLGSKCDTDAQKFIVADGVAALPDRSRLAGSIQPLSQMVRNLVFDAGIQLCDAVTMASLTPAKIINADDRLGSIETGKLADICILDKELNVIMTVTNGKIVYDAKENTK